MINRLIANPPSPLHSMVLAKQPMPKSSWLTSTSRGRHFALKIGSVQFYLGPLPSLVLSAVDSDLCYRCSDCRLIVNAQLDSYSIGFLNLFVYTDRGVWYHNWLMMPLKRHIPAGRKPQNFHQIRVSELQTVARGPGRVAMTRTGDTISTA